MAKEENCKAIRGNHEWKQIHTLEKHATDKIHKNNSQIKNEIKFVAYVDPLRDI